MDVTSLQTNSQLNLFEREMGEKVEKGLDLLISEYLTSQGYLDTAATFKTEKSKQQPKPQGSVHPELLEAFEGGERHAFFELWNMHVPVTIRSENVQCQRLECNVSAYFAVYPLRTGIGNREQAMSEFRSYLDNRGSTISQNQELAAYFALPYIPDPSKHPTFQNLFLKSWTEELRARLVQFLEQVIPRPSSCPALLTLYLNSKKATGAVLQEDCIQKVGEVQTAYHTLCSIAMELVGALESSVAGEQIAPEFISSICKRLFEGGVNQPPPTVARPSTSTIRASILSLRQSVEVSDHSPHTYPPLDFTKIKQTLQNGCTSEQISLLQALRWRLTRSLPGEQRDTILTSYISNDLLDCARYQRDSKTGSSKTGSSVLTLMKSPDLSIREQLARLFNTFSSLASGRSYLSDAPPITIALLDLLYEEGGDDTTVRRNALGALQKLSLRRSISRLMIKHSIVKWIVEEAIGDSDSISDYTLRYSLALLMNISLRVIGRTACAAHGTVLLEALAGMLGHEEEEISEYINGTLYSLFSSTQLQQQARQMGMREFLEEALQRSPAQRRAQLQYILHQLNQPLSPEGEEPEDSGDEGQEDDEDDEPDPDMIEGDEGEVVVPKEGVLSGETLLIKEYAFTEARPQTKSLPAGRGGARGGAVQPPTLSSSPSPGPRLQAVKDSAPAIRPVTPQTFRSHSSADINKPSAASQFPDRKIVSASFSMKT